jgi:predicted histidine transporter YuiF (NhaC family)
MNARQRNRLINLNRLLILVLTLVGLLMDGLQISDLLCTLALIVWLWLPLCTRLEVHLASGFKNFR